MNITNVTLPFRKNTLKVGISASLKKMIFILKNGISAEIPSD